VAVASFSDVIDRVKSGVIRIEARGCGGPSVGTGFLVKPNLVATVEHVVDGATTITLKRNGRFLATAPIIGLDRDRDLALLKTGAPIEGYSFGFARPTSPRHAISPRRSRSIDFTNTSTPRGRGRLFGKPHALTPRRTTISISQPG
jgi:hypothetical protein